MVGIYVRDQDEALEFYVGKLGFRVVADVRYGTIDAGFRDPAGNGWKLIQASRSAA